MLIAASGGVVGCGQFRCSGRLMCHLAIFRLTSLGFVRKRRSGSGSARISAIACWWAAARLRGGKSRVGAGAAPGGSETAGEGQSVGVEVGLERGVVHQPPDRVMGAEVAVGLLDDPVGVL